ncbi:MAG: class C sortase [Clostridia bacterium]|nr:class C sortase [Clostridia bacterium]
MASVKKRVKRRLPLLFIFIVLIAGVGLFMYPKVSNWVSVYTAKTEIGSYDKAVQKLDNTDKEKLRKQAQEYNKALAENNHEKLKKFNYDEILSVSSAMAYIDIPKIKVYIPIFHGTDDEELQQGVGHMKDTSFPVGDKSTHSVIAGHTGLPTAEIFTDIDQLVKGDVFYIHVLDEILAYKVDQIKVVLPDETEDTQIVQGEDYVTLLTCTPYGINDHRLLVRGTRIPYNKQNEDIANNMPVQADTSEDRLPVETILTLLVVGLSIVVVVIMLLILFLPVGKKHRKNKKSQQNQ